MGNTIIPKLFSDYRKLLWSNPSPSSGFAAQTISLDLSGYDEVEIQCLASAGGVDFVTARCVVGKAIMAQFVSGGNGYGNGTPFLTERRFVTSTTGIIVSTGYGCFTGGSDWSYNSATRMIPLKIYGINYEKVAPGVIDAEIESLAAGATLHRIGRMRMLVLSDFAYGTEMSALASGDRPSSTATGMGLRYNNSAYFCFIFIAVNTNGNISISNVGTYNTSSGMSTPVAGDKFNATVVWYVPD